MSKPQRATTRSRLPTNPRAPAGLRDRIATAVAAAIVSDDGSFLADGGTYTRESPREIAVCAYRVADALLAVRKLRRLP